MAAKAGRIRGDGAGEAAYIPAIGNGDGLMTSIVILLVFLIAFLGLNLFEKGRFD